MLKRGAVVAWALAQLLILGLQTPVRAQSAIPGIPFSCVVQTNGNTALTAVGGSCIAPDAQTSLYITDILFSVSAANVSNDGFPTLKAGTGGTCGTATTIIWGALTASAYNTPQTFRTPLQVPKANELCWITTAAGVKFLVITGYKAPG